MAIAGGMAVQRAVAERWKQVTGVPLIEGYGLTETSPVAISNPLDIEDWTGTIGVPIPSTEAAVLDDDGREVADGRGRRDLHSRPAGDEGLLEPPRRDGEGVHARTAGSAPATWASWMRAGYFKITDRKKDMIIVSGFKVFPNEIEDVVMMHPGVLEVAAIGAPDAKSGEAGEGRRRAQGSGAHRAGAARALPEEPHRLQGAEDRRVPDRAAAEDEHRQDTAPPVAPGGVCGGGGGGEGGGGRGRLGTLSRSYRRCLRRYVSAASLALKSLSLAGPAFACDGGGNQQCSQNRSSMAGCRLRLSRCCDAGDGARRSGANDRGLVRGVAAEGSVSRAIQACLVCAGAQTARSDLDNLTLEYALSPLPRSPRGAGGHVQRKGAAMSIGTILIIILILILVGALPTWPYSRSWGYGPTGIAGVVVIVLIVLLLMGRI